MQRERAHRQLREARPVLGHRSHGRSHEKVLVFHDWMGDSGNCDPLIPYLDANAYTCVFADARG